MKQLTLHGDRDRYPYAYLTQYRTLCDIDSDPRRISGVQGPRVLGKVQYTMGSRSRSRSSHAPIKVKSFCRNLFTTWITSRQPIRTELPPDLKGDRLCSSSMPPSVAVIISQDENFGRHENVRRLLEDLFRYRRTPLLGFRPSIEDKSLRGCVVSPLARTEASGCVICSVALSTEMTRRILTELDACALVWRAVTVARSEDETMLCFAFSLIGTRAGRSERVWLTAVHPTADTTSHIHWGWRIAARCPVNVGGRNRSSEERFREDQRK